MSCQPSNSELARIPCDFVANESALEFFTALAGLGAVVVLVTGLVVTRRTRSPLYACLVFSSALNVFVEPIGDVFTGIYIPSEAPFRMFTLMGRPMPLGDLFVWIWLGFGFYFAYELMRRGAPVRQVVAFAAGLGAAELTIEIGMAQTGAWIYYSNPALVFGVPIYVLVQNIGIVVVGGAALMMVMPHVRGARWLIFLFFSPVVTMAFCIGTAFVAYYGIHSHFHPVVGWTLGIVAAVINVIVVYAALHIDPVASARRAAAAAKADAASAQPPVRSRV